MSELNGALEFLEGQSKTVNPETNKRNIIIDNSKPFDISVFEDELYNKSYEQNKVRLNYSHQNITGYDICSNCIQEVIFKLRNTPITQYADCWLPIFMRTEIGNATHKFIQSNTSQFTETELNLKVPSIRFYGKIDYAIGSSILGEIKSVPYNEYASIVKNQKPREKDFLQLMTYVYMIENYLDEILSEDTKVSKRNGLKPQLNQYDIKTIQFLYIAHDIISSNETESLTAARKRITELKRQVRSKNNQFFFISAVTLDINDEVKEPVFKYIKDKISDIHHYMNTNTNPDKDSRFVQANPNKCLFCLYNEICDLKNM